MRGWGWLVVGLVACGPTELEGDGPRIASDGLPVARTHVPWTGWLEARGGTPPLRWSVEGELPPGIALNAAGALTGVAVEPGTWPVDVSVVDAEGLEDAARVTVEVRWARNTVACGDGAEGALDGVADLGEAGVDWGATDGWTTLEVPLPDPEISRVAVSLDTDASAWLARPGTAAGSEALARDYLLLDPDEPLVVDLGTVPDLESYRAYGEPLQVLLAAATPGPWSASTECTAGPVIVDSDQAPSLLGAPLTVNYSVHGPQDTVTWSVEGALPPWAVFDPESGRIEGLAAELGTWEITVVATDAEGRSDRLETGFGVLQPIALACEEVVGIDVSEGYREGAAQSIADPDGYRVFALEPPATLSTVTAWYEAPGSGQLALVDPGDAPWRPGDPAVDADEPATLSLALPPVGDPGLADHLPEGVVHAVAWVDEGAVEPARFWFACDHQPRPALSGLPVLEPGGVEQLALEGLGGTPPYTWSATGLPAGTSLGPGGLLATAAPAAGATSVELVLTDALGASSQTALDLFVGDEAACQGALRLSCGSVVDGELAAEERLPICLDTTVTDRDLAALTLTLPLGGSVDLLLAPPGGLPEQAEERVLAARGVGSAGFAFDYLRRPHIGAWRDLPAFLVLEAASAAPWELAVDCP